jgi:Bacterial SH3 domain
MKFSSAAACTAVFAALVALAPVCASAAPGVVNTSVNLRQGPGTSTPIIGKIPAGSPVEVGTCSGEWCQATFEGMSGYVIASALAQGGAYGGPPPGAPRRGYPPPPPGYAGPPPYAYPGPGPYSGGPYYGPYYGYGPPWRRW